MSIRRKLFTAMASFILAMGVVFALTTHFVVRGILNVMLEVDRTDEIAAISGMLEQYYRDNGGSWDGVAQLSVLGVWRRRVPTPASCSWIPKGGRCTRTAPSIATK
jgi:hypothetical protein